MVTNKVTARFKDGTLLKGKTSDFSPDKSGFHLELQDGRIVEVTTEELKALFFVKDLIGNKDRKDSYGDNIPGGGRKIQVKFRDGEILIGYSQGCSLGRKGFFMIPADKGSNNERIFIISSAVEKITYL